MKKELQEKSCLNCKKFAGCTSCFKGDGTICIDYVSVLKNINQEENNDRN